MDVAASVANMINPSLKAILIGRSSISPVSLTSKNPSCLSLVDELALESFLSLKSRTSVDTSSAKQSSVSCLAAGFESFDSLVEQILLACCLVSPEETCTLDDEVVPHDQPR